MKDMFEDVIVIIKICNNDDLLFKQILLDLLRLSSKMSVA